MPKDDIASLAVAIYVSLLVEMSNVFLVLFVGFISVCGVIIKVQFAMAFRPNCKSSALWWHVVDVTYNAEMKRMSVGMAGSWFFWLIPFW